MAESLRSSAPAAPWLRRAGTGLLLAVLPILVLLALDGREISGVRVWLKPLKFTLSNGIFALTLGLLLGELSGSDRFVRRVDRWTASILVGEQLLIVLQAARGVRSHFNGATPFDFVVVGLMGIGITVILVMMVQTAFKLAKTPTLDPAWRTAVRAGLWLSLAGASVGLLMGAPRRDQLARVLSGDLSVVGAHSVGGADGGASMPLTGWSRQHGDLRVPHFVGLHSLQVLPLLAWATAGRGLGRRRKRLVRAAAGILAALFGILLWQALRGEPVLAPGSLSLAALGLWAVGSLVLVAAALRPRIGVLAS